ncbi:MAG: glycerol kinase, partial [Kordiimonadaceae bacterium]|nr:glycerol kinase [Kordiimonadaceae bacterium]
MKYVLGLDQGTTSSRAILFDDKMHPAFIAQQEFEQIFPASGWVEHNPDDIWTTTLCTAKEVLDKAGISTSDIVSIGITNQRETTIIWDKNTGEPIYNAIVWQDRRTADICESLKDRNLEPEINLKTGLLLDPYFSGTKIKWLLDNIAGARENVDKLLFGTVDSFLIWKLTGGRSHLTDATNASRTMLYNIDKGCWDAD